MKDIEGPPLAFGKLTLEGPPRREPVGRSHLRQVRDEERELPTHVVTPGCYPPMQNAPDAAAAPGS